MPKVTQNVHANVEPEDDEGNIFEPLSPVHPETDPDIVAAEVRGIRSRVPRGPAGDALLSEQLTCELTRLVSQGLPLDSAAKACGLRRTTLSKWLSRGQADVEDGKDSAEARLAWAIDQALGVQELVLVRSTMRGAKQDPRHALEVLSRRRPADWAQAAPRQEDWRANYGRMNESELRAEVQRLLGEAKKESESEGDGR